MKRAIWGVGGFIGVVAVALVAALVAGGPEPDGAATVAAAGRSAVTGPTVASTSSTVAPSTTTTTAVATTTTVRPTTTTTTTDAPATTVPLATTTTVAENLGPPGPTCTASMFSALVTMSKPAFTLGEPVTATATFRNTSGQTCYLASTQGGIQILNAAGANQALGAVRIGDYFRWSPVAAGETISEPWTWDQQVCTGNGPCRPATPGHYTFVVTEQPYGSGRATFDITA